MNISRLPGPVLVLTVKAPCPRKLLSALQTGTVGHSGSRPHKRLPQVKGRVRRSPLLPYFLKVGRGVGGGDPFLQPSPGVVALLFVSLATGRGNPHLGGPRGPSNHTHRHTQTHTAAHTQARASAPALSAARPRAHGRRTGQPCQSPRHSTCPN